MQKQRAGAALIVAGAVGLVLMVVAAGLVIHQYGDIGSRADEVLDPLAGGIEDFQTELDRVEQLVDDLVEVLPTETVVHLAGQVNDFALGLGTLEGYLEGARRGVAALDGIPFLPIDLGDVTAQLKELDAGLASLTTQLEEVTRFILENRDVPAQIAEGLYSGIDEVRTGLDAAEAEVASVSDATDRWLVTVLVLTLVVLGWAIAGQITMILWGREKRRVEDDG